MTNEEPKSAQPAPNLNSILEAGTEGLETLALSGLGLGFRAAIPKMPSFRVSYIFFICLYYFYYYKYCQERWLNREDIRLEVLTRKIF